jgi:predicted dehydrogenase
VPVLRVGLLGYGLAGRVIHAPLITATPDLELASVVTADPRRGAARPPPSCPVWSC